MPFGISFGRGSAAGGSDPAALTSGSNRVAILAADYVKHIEDVKKKLNVSTAYSLSSGVPKLEVLSNFDVLFVWTASWARDGGATEYDRDKTGNVLADYVEGGGKVIMCYTNPMPGGRWPSV
eukprot:gene12917-13080_t